MRYFLFLLLVLPVCFRTQAQVLSGRAIEIKDGDSFVLRTTSGSNITIRLNGIDCPEKGQDFGKRAKEFTASFCKGSTVEVHVVEQDKYGRKVADVYVNGSSLNKALVRSGLAWHYKKYSNDSELAALEEQARADRTGLWSMASPMPPWTYRRGGSMEPVGPLQSNEVIICNSTGSKTYHNKMCQGLSRCTKGTKKISESSATEMGRTRCGYCFK